MYGLMPTLQEVRKRRFLSIRELAAKANVATRTIVQIEAGRLTPRYSTMRKIASALNRSADGIYMGDVNLELILR